MEYVTNDHVYKANVRNTISHAVIYIVTEGEDINVCEEWHKFRQIDMLFIY